MALLKDIAIDKHFTGVLIIKKKRYTTLIPDGLLKIWNVETSESVGSFDAHDDKIWSVESLQKKIVTGGRDGQVQIELNVFLPH